ncbi:MAG TPA: DUF484 family protein [Chromatiaceae bacterium]|nr:DUF484 family protein [Chromatiaceae bacterium]
MSVQQEEGVTDSFDPRDVVIDFLASNPEFFAENLDLLSTLSLPHPSGKAISLVERQLSLFREKHHKLNTRLQHLIQIARDNEQLSIRLHKLTLGLVDANATDELLQICDQRLRRDFQISHMRVRLVKPGSAQLHSEHDQLFFDSNDTDYEILKPFLNAKRPVCGKLSEPQEEALFHDDALSIQSAALIPLAGNGVVGLLALASHDAKRFQRGMGTLFLTQLGDLVAHGLARFIPQDA